MLTAERANAARCSGRGGTYEAWYVTLNDPSTRRGFWIRYTTFGPATGAAASPHAALWAFAFDHDDPGANWGARQTFPLEAAEVRHHPFALRLGGAVLALDGCAGELRAERGLARWDLRWESREPPFPFLDPRFQGLSSVANTASHPALTITGTVDINGRRHRLERAGGGQQHTWGTGHALEWNWGFATGPDFWVDGATSRIRSRVGRVLNGTAIGAGVGVESVRFNGPIHVLRSPGVISPDAWVASVGLGARRLEVSVRPRRQDLVGVTYDDPSGGKRYCYHTEVADLDMTMTRRGGDPIRVSRPASAAFEYASQNPLPGVTLAV